MTASMRANRSAETLCDEGGKAGSWAKMECANRCARKMVSHRRRGIVFNGEPSIGFLSREDTIPATKSATDRSYRFCRATNLRLPPASLACLHRPRCKLLTSENSAAGKDYRN